VSKLARNVFIPTSYSVWTAPLGTALPTSPLTAPSAAFYEVGFLSDQGVTEGRDINETLIYDLVGQLVATARNQEARPFTFEALEDNRVVRELRYPNSTLATAAGTAEVQTITLTGTGTAGTWSLTLPGYGTASALTYNITTSALATALNAAFGVSGITVSGTAGSSYIVTFPASMGNVALMQYTQQHHRRHRHRHRRDHPGRPVDQHPLRRVRHRPEPPRVAAVPGEGQRPQAVRHQRR
jgi:hypothetical protein